MQVSNTMKLLITVKTYPSPSLTYDEIVCTAGVLEDGTFVRIYPVDYRYKPYWQWYKKYQWVEVAVERNAKDPRPESYSPIAAIRPTGEPLGTQNCWQQRKLYVLSKAIPTMCYLQEQPQSEISLAIIKPGVVEDLLVEPSEREWNRKTAQRMSQLRLFGQDHKPLEKIPYKFSYLFKCTDPLCNGHKMMIEDWEIGALYRRMRDKYGEDKIGRASCRERV